MLSSDLIRKRVLITGANGMLGNRLVKFFHGLDNYQVLATSVEKSPVFKDVEYICCDLTQRESVKKIALDFYPDFIINTAAFTNVDLCEQEREQAWKVNVKAVEYLSEIARILDARLIHISTDYIFDGTAGPYSENAKPNPQSYYARTKLASENVLRISGVLYTILRTNVLYGSKINNKPDFVIWVIDNLRKKNQIRIVTDQISNPTFVDDLVQAISKVVQFRKTGIFNIGGKEFISRYDFTCRIADFFNLDKSLILPITTAELNQPARRPLKSGLLTIKAESELGYKAHSFEESFTLMKKENSL
ncbi:MAG: dTDP-4-dehydrorhamnose reductase [Ignavibacteriaceae bacterium]